LIEDRSRFILPFAILAAILAVSTSSIFIKFAQRDAPSLVIAALRLAIASLVLLPVAATRHRRELSALSRSDLLLGLSSGIFLAVHFATWISSLEYTSVASSVVLVSTGPLWVALLSPIFLKEPLTRFVLIGMSLALPGGAVIALGDACSFRWTVNLLNISGPHISCPPFSEFARGKTIFGNFLALAGAWAVAGYLLIGRRLRASMSLIPYIFVVYGSAAIVLLVAMFVAGEHPGGYSPPTYLWITLLALVPQLVGHTTYNWALRYLPAALVSLTTLAEPVGSAFLAYLILAETPTILTFIGGVLILAGIYLATRAKQSE
jgi:drug/metabolite transporter (DMT)-like permease